MSILNEHLLQTGHIFNELSDILHSQNKCPKLNLLELLEIKRYDNKQMLKDHPY